MKCSLFVHMERIAEHEVQRDLYDQFVTLCEMADEGGMHAIWTGEHHGMDFTIAPNPFLNLVDLARRTRNVRLGTGTVIAPFWHPIKLAGEAAMTDLITGGRLELGIARGAYSFEYERLLPGLDAWAGRTAHARAAAGGEQLWAGDYAHEGEFWQFPSTTSAPKPLQPAGPADLGGGARSQQPRVRGGQRLSTCRCTPLWQGDDGGREPDGALQRRLRRHMRTAPPEDHAAAAHLCGRQRGRYRAGGPGTQPFLLLLRRLVQERAPIRQGLIEPLSDEEMAAMEMYSAANMRANNVIGEADEVIDRLKAYEALGYDEYAFWIDSGMSFERKKASLERFIDEVMPAFAEAA